MRSVRLFHASVAANIGSVETFNRLKRQALWFDAFYYFNYPDVDYSALEGQIEELKATLSYLDQKGSLGSFPQKAIMLRRKGQKTILTLHL